MATLYITEIDQLGIDSQGNTIMAGVYPPLVEPYSIPITGSSGQSQVFASTTRFIEIENDVTCSFKIGTNPIAVTTAGRLGAGQHIFYPLRTQGGPYRIAVITNT